MAPKDSGGSKMGDGVGEGFADRIRRGSRKALVEGVKANSGDVVVVVLRTGEE